MDITRVVSYLLSEDTYCRYVYMLSMIFSCLSCRLFHVIVDNDRTASQILSIMNKQKLPGEVTFLPLNKLNPPRMEYPNAKNVRIYVLEPWRFVWATVEHL